jgi:diguanylate cyclase (GGDEF)-like protein
VSSEGFGARSVGQVFAAAAAAVARSDDLDEALAELVGLAAEHLGAALGGAYILDQDRDELELVVTLHVPAEAGAEAATVGPVAESDDPLAETVRSRRIVPVEDASGIGLLRGTSSTAVLLPLVVRRDGIELALGAMALGFAGPLPDPDRLALAEPLADLAAVAVERALALSLGSERAEWFERLAHTDPLTGLANRRTLDRMLELELARASRQGAPLSLTLFDVDRFEDIERDGGHGVADDVLKRIAQVLAESVRLVDTVARYGGSEFMLVAPGPDGIAVADRLARAIGNLDPVAGQPLAVSAGVAHFPVDGRTPEELNDAAARAMREARAAGGGRAASASADVE